MAQQPMQPQYQQLQPQQPSMVQAQPRGIPTWLKAALIGMGICTPGGFLFLFALITSTHVNFDRAVWFILALVGGGAGWLMGRAASK